MKASRLTKAEEKWIERVQALLDDCPSKRLAAYTIGDNCITIYDGSKEAVINAAMDSNSDTDHCNAVDDCDAGLTSLRFPFLVHSTAG